MKYVLFSLSDEIILPRQKGVALKNGQKGKLTNSTFGWQIANDPLKRGVWRGGGGNFKQDKNKRDLSSHQL